MPKAKKPMTSAQKKKAAVTRCVNKCRKSDSASKKAMSAKRKAAQARAVGNKWIQFVKAWSAANGVGYSDALRDGRCQAEYKLSK